MKQVGWSVALSAILQLINLLLKTASERRSQRLSEEERKIGHAQAIAETFQDAAELVKQAKDARLDVRDRLRIDPDSLREDDGFKR